MWQQTYRYTEGRPSDSLAVSVFLPAPAAVVWTTAVVQWSFVAVMSAPADVSWTPVVVAQRLVPARLAPEVEVMTSLSDLHH